jgi:hypothetical protein
MTSNCAWRWEGGGIGRVEVWFRFGEWEGRLVLRHRRDEEEEVTGEAEVGKGEGAGEQGNLKRRVRKIDLGDVILGMGGSEDEEEEEEEGKIIKEVAADLQWGRGETLVFCGFVSCRGVGVVEVSLLVFIFTYLLSPLSLYL